MICSRQTQDPLLQELVKKYGMNLLVPPTPSIDPGDLIVSYKDNTARKAGWVSTLGANPAPNFDSHAAPTSLAFEVSRHLDMKAGLSLTGRILESFGLTSAKAGAGFAKTAALKLNMEIIAPSQRLLNNLDEMLASLSNMGSANSVAFQGKDLYVVTRAYRAKGLRITLFDKDGAVVKATGSTAAELKVGVSLSVGADLDGSYSFKSPTEALVFGITVRKLVLRDGLVADEPPTTYFGLRDTEELPCNFIADDDAFIGLLQEDGKSSADV